MPTRTISSNWSLAVSISGTAQHGDVQATLRWDAIITKRARQRKVEANRKAEPQNIEQGTAEFRSADQLAASAFISLI
jgi:hypothetical protein